MATGALRIQVVPRGPRLGDEGVTDAVVQLLRRALRAGAAGPHGLVVRPGSFDVVDLASVRRAGLPIPWLLAGLTTSVTDHGPAEAVGVLGRMIRRVEGAELSVGLVFLEWEDNRWWSHEAPLDADGRALAEAGTVELDARRGDALPAGLGRWWSAARRRGVRMDLRGPASAPAN